jgi:voltage-gated potassium channel
VASFLFGNRAKSTAAAAVACLFFVVTGAGALVLELESNSPRATIRTAGDAAWWAMSTITTVGYGDVTPVTTGGRLVGAVLMVAGISLFGVIATLVAGWLLREVTGSRTDTGHILDELRAIRERLDQISPPAKSDEPEEG